MNDICLASPVFQKVIMLWFFQFFYLETLWHQAVLQHTTLTYNSVVTMQCYLTDYPRYRLVIKLLSFHIIYFYLYWSTYFGGGLFFPCALSWAYFLILCPYCAMASFALAPIAFLLGVLSFGAIVSQHPLHRALLLLLLWFHWILLFLWFLKFVLLILLLLLNFFVQSTFA